MTSDIRSNTLQSNPSSSGLQLLESKSCNLQRETSKTDAQGRQEPVEKLLDERKQVVDNHLQAQQQTRERSDKRRQAAEERGCDKSALTILHAEFEHVLRPRVPMMLSRAPLMSSKRFSTREARAVLV